MSGVRLAEWLISTPEVCGSNPSIGKFTTLLPIMQQTQSPVIVAHRFLITDKDSSKEIEANNDPLEM